MVNILNTYYSNNASKLRKMVDKILIKLKFHDIDNEDFYSLANEIFVDVLRRYDKKQDFDGFLYGDYNLPIEIKLLKQISPSKT
mgnify:CR=1 FL=1